jgi:hypothetical protein
LADERTHLAECYARGGRSPQSPVTTMRTQGCDLSLSGRSARGDRSSAARRADSRDITDRPAT